MKFTFVLNSIDRVGGVRVVFEYATRLQQRGHQVHLVYPAVNLAFLKTRSFGGLILWLIVSAARRMRNAIRKNPQQPFEVDTHIIKIPLFHPRFIHLVEESIPDADVVVATAWETAYPVSRLHPKKGRQFYFVQNYEIWDSWRDEDSWSKAKRLKRMDEICALAMADVTPKKKRLKASKEAVDRSFSLSLKKITIAEWLRRLIEDKFGQKVEAVIPNGVNFDIFFKQGNSRRESPHINVLMPYRREKLKGFNDGVKALARVRARHPNVRFTVFGRRPPINFGKLPKLPAWIEFHDGISDAQLRALYNEAHIFVVPSWIEGFPLPPMEAMACGCAVVTTDAGGFSDYLKDGETALVVPIRNPRALASGVCWLIEHDDECLKMAENGHRFVQQFTWERATDELEAILMNESSPASPLER